jgi:hypothetical protein
VGVSSGYPGAQGLMGDGTSSRFGGVLLYLEGIRLFGGSMNYKAFLYITDLSQFIAE